MALLASQRFPIDTKVPPSASSPRPAASLAGRPVASKPTLDGKGCCSCAAGPKDRGQQLLYELDLASGQEPPRLLTPAQAAEGRGPSAHRGRAAPRLERMRVTNPRLHPVPALGGRRGRCCWGCRGSSTSSSAPPARVTALQTGEGRADRSALQPRRPARPSTCADNERPCGRAGEQPSSSASHAGAATEAKAARPRGVRSRRRRWAASAATGLLPTARANRPGKPPDLTGVEAVLDWRIR